MQYFMILDVDPNQLATIHQYNQEYCITKYHTVTKLLIFYFNLESLLNRNQKSFEQNWIFLLFVFFPLQKGGYSCTCNSGWSGTHCESNIDECLSNPCQNNATCNDKTNGFECVCTPGFEGKLWLYYSLRSKLRLKGFVKQHPLRKFWKYICQEAL